jgi:hypothetical protein
MQRACRHAVPAAARRAARPRSPVRAYCRKKPLHQTSVRRDDYRPWQEAGRRVAHHRRLLQTHASASGVAERSGRRGGRCCRRLRAVGRVMMGTTHGPRTSVARARAAPPPPPQKRTSPPRAAASTGSAVRVVSQQPPRSLCLKLTTAPLAMSFTFSGLRCVSRAPAALGGCSAAASDAGADAVPAGGGPAGPMRLCSGGAARAHCRGA